MFEGAIIAQGVGSPNIGSVFSPNLVVQAEFGITWGQSVLEEPIVIVESSMNQTRVSRPDILRRFLDVLVNPTSISHRVKIKANWQ